MTCEANDPLPFSAEGKEVALARILAEDPMPVPDDPRELRAEWDNAHQDIEC